MKVLWYVNIIMPEAGKALNLKAPNVGGWLTGALEGLRSADITLTVMTVTGAVKDIQRVCQQHVCYVLIPDQKSQRQMEQILLDEKPDLVHIFGTEYSYNTDLVHLCRKHNIKHVIAMQGIVRACAEHYADGLSVDTERSRPFVKWVRRIYYADSIALEKKRFAQQGVLETEALRQSQAVMGRTDWDRAMVLSVNPNLRYYHVGESLRDVFYEEDSWKYENCVPHSIFISQSAYPIKGFHMLLEAMPALLERYPDLRVTVGGQAPYTLHNRVLDMVVDYFFEYQDYIKKRIRKLGLQNHIHYTGMMDEQQMKQQYLKSNVFLSCSTLENSPNSVGEAMILGVPVVASNVGGTSSVLTDGQDGFLYDFYDREAMIRAISTLFDDRQLAKTMGTSARKHALENHDREKNTAALLSVYRSIAAEDPL